MNKILLLFVLLSFTGISQNSNSDQIRDDSPGELTSADSNGSNESRSCTREKFKVKPVIGKTTLKPIKRIKRYPPKGKSEKFYFLYEKDLKF